MNVHKAKVTMPAGLSKTNSQEVTSSVGDAVGHLPCRGGKFFMDGSPQNFYVLFRRGVICLICPCNTLLMPQAPHWVPKM